MSKSPSASEVMQNFTAHRLLPRLHRHHQVGRKILEEHPGHHRQPGLRDLRGGGKGRVHRRATAMFWAAF